jgi:hypothetical protein
VTLQANPGTVAVSEQSAARIRADSLTIANLYGSTIAVAVQAAPVIYEAFNTRPNDVTAVTAFARVLPPRDATCHNVDRYA